MAGDAEELEVFEADAYARIEFCIKRDGTIVIQELDCSLTVQIAGLKEDVSDTFGASAENQIWHHNGVLLADYNCLENYNIINDREKSIIVVTFRNSHSVS